MENNFAQGIESIFSNLEKFIKTETVVGEPIVVGEVTLVPVISVCFGCGAGSGTGTDKDNVNGNGAGGGGGAKISPNGIVVIKNGEVSLLPINNKGNIESLLKMVPEIVSKISCKKDAEEKEEEKEDKE